MSHSGFTAAHRPGRRLGWALAGIGLAAGCSDAPNDAASNTWLADASRGVELAQSRPETIVGGYHTLGQRHGVNARFTIDGAALGPDALTLSLVGFGRGEAPRPVAKVAPTLQGCADDRVDVRGDCLPRVTYAHDGVTETWTNDLEALEHAFVLERRPGGVGELALVVGVHGAEAALEDPDSVALWTDTGAMLRYWGALAWDADGEPLPARLDVADGSIVIRVDDSGARWPIVVDPLVTTPDDTITTNQAGAAFGTSVAFVGDVDKDGYDDVAVGAPTYESGTTETSEGIVYLFYGTSSGLPTTADWSYEGAESGAQLGFSVAGGDFNGDGYADVVAGAPYDDSSTLTDAGKGYIFYGSSSGLGTTAGWALNGDGASAWYGWAVGSGNFNGDSYDDFFIAEPALDFSYADAGAIVVFHGGSAGISTTASTWYTGGGQASAMWGGAAVAGDFNGDGYDDFAVGGPKYDYSKTNDGLVRVYHGSSTGLSSTVSWLNTTANAGDLFGTAIASGDWDGDGYEDIAIGAPGFSSNKGLYVGWKGSSSGLVSTSYRIAYGTSSGDTFATALHGGGDIDGDGYDDLIVGVPGYDNGSTNEGQAKIYNGSSSGIATTTTSWTYEPDSASAGLGNAVAGGGDLDGDGEYDVIVGASGYSDGETGEGGIFVFSHGVTDADKDGSPATLDCNDADATIYPGATESCNSKDDDCDGSTDEGVTTTYYIDSDADGYGSTSTTKAACSLPTGYATTSTDCNDASSTISPAGSEVCDSSNADEDCDGKADDADSSVASSGKTSWYADADKDGYGSSTATAVSYCDDPSTTSVTYKASKTDCDDTTSAVSPGVTETCGNGVDDNCDGTGGGGAADDDADGLAYSVEKAAGASDCDTDSDDDTVKDADEYGSTTSARDSDADGKPDLVDTDDDNDTYATSAEDTDGNGSKLNDDADADGIPDYREADEDGDGITHLVEATHGTEVYKADSDADGVNDGAEWGSATTASPRDSDGDGTTDPLDADDDDDGIATLDEGDSDIDGDKECDAVGDGTPNYLDDDSDGDGRLDKLEGTGDIDEDGVANFLDCNDADGCTGDSDGDTLQNCDERDFGMNPADPDSDGDGVRDDVELGPGPAARDTDGDKVIDPLDTDDDGDGLSTPREDVDGDGDPRNDDADGDKIPNYLDADDDNDGIPTLAEDLDSDGDYDEHDADGNGVPDWRDVSGDGPEADADGDGIKNKTEDRLGTDRRDIDSDDDGVPDNEELGFDPASDPDGVARDSDSDTTIDALDPDDDGDGIPTSREGPFDADKDGTPNHLDLDSDGDGILDASESDEGDADCDGVVEFLDADETDGPCAKRDTGGDTNDGYVPPKVCSSTSASGAGFAAAFAALLLIRRRRR